MNSIIFRRNIEWTPLSSGVPFSLFLWSGPCRFYIIFALVAPLKIKYMILCFYFYHYSNQKKGGRMIHKILILLVSANFLSSENRKPGKLLCSCSCFSDDFMLKWFFSFVPRSRRLLAKLLRFSKIWDTAGQNWSSLCNKWGKWSKIINILHSQG